MARRKPGRMGNKGDKVFEATDKELADVEIELLKKTSIDWQALRPKVNNPELYDKLISVVSEATKKNESLAQIKNRVKQLGKEGIALAKTVTKMLT